MRRLVAVAPFLLLLALLSACGGGSDEPTQPAATPAFPGSDWRLEYSISGGIAGMSQQLVLDEKGNAAARRQARQTHALRLRRAL